MRMHLYRVDAKAGSRDITVHVIAATEDLAAVTAYNDFEALGVNASFMRFERVDQSLPGDMQQGLDVMLETAPSAFASFCPGVGWIAHLVPEPRLKLFAINLYGDDQRVVETHFLIAPNRSMAATIFAQCKLLDGGKARLLHVYDPAEALDEAMKAGLADLLPFGPAGMVAWDEVQGWLRV